MVEESTRIRRAKRRRDQLRAPSNQNHDRWRKCSRRWSHALWKEAMLKENRSSLATIQKSTGWDKGLLENMGCRIRQAVEEKRRENIEERDKVAEQEQNKKVRFEEEKQPVETQEQSTDKQDVMYGLEELRTGRGSRPLVRGGR